MSYERCQELCVKYVIRAPDQLRKAIRIARNALDEGTLSEIETTNGWNQYNFHECAEKMVWGGIVDYHFACNLLPNSVRSWRRNLSWQRWLLVTRK